MKEVAFKIKDFLVEFFMAGVHNHRYWAVDRSTGLGFLLYGVKRLSTFLNFLKLCNLFRQQAILLLNLFSLYWFRSWSALLVFSHKFNSTDLINTLSWVTFS